jgi:hypothetical protein
MGRRETLIKRAQCQLVHYKPYIFFYYYLVCEAIGTAATPGLLCQPRVLDSEDDCGDADGM